MFRNCFKMVGGFPTGTSGTLKAIIAVMAVFSLTRTWMRERRVSNVAARVVDQPPHVLLRAGWGEVGLTGPEYVGVFDGIVCSGDR